MIRQSELCGMYFLLINPEKQLKLKVNRITNTTCYVHMLYKVHMLEEIVHATKLSHLECHDVLLSEVAEYLMVVKRQRSV